MIEKKPKKEKVKIETRAPQKRIGIFDNLGKGKQQNVKHPMADFLATDELSPTPTDVPTNTPTYLPTAQKTPALSPEKDFAKVPNSIKRAVEDGKFPNSSLAIYMYLYSLTRGAIQPKRSVRVNKAKLLNGANLRAEKALLKNLAHLKNTGLLKITVFNGDHAGNEYEVFVPEEIDGDQPTHLPTKQPTYLLTKHTPVPTVQTSVGRWVQSVENIEENEPLRLSLKTNTNDDELTRKIEDFVRAKFGRELTEKEKQNLMPGIADLVFLEFEQAASRTESISDAAAFLIEHLRRKLSANNSIKASAKNSTSIVKSENPVEVLPESKLPVEPYQPEPLTEEGRESALEIMRDMLARGENIDYLKKSYTPIDWKYFRNKLQN